MARFPKAGNTEAIREDRNVAENADISDNVRGVALATELPPTRRNVAKSKTERRTVVPSI